MSDEERIRSRAHAIWEQQGRPEGHADHHWHQACAEIAGETPRRKAAAAGASPARRRSAPARPKAQA